MKRSMFVIRYRWHIIIATLVLVVAAVIPLFSIKINPDLESYMPESMQSKQNNRKINEIFGTNEVLLIVFSTADILNVGTLERVKAVSEVLEEIPEFSEVYSLFKAVNITSFDGSMLVEPLIGDLPKDDIPVEKLRKAIVGNDMAYKLVVSEDFKYTSVIVGSDKSLSDNMIMTKIDSVLALNPGDEKVFITGQPYLRNDAYYKIGHDIMVLLPVGLVVMFIILLVSFSEPRAVALPFIVVVFSILVSMSMIPLLGWDLSLIGVLIPIMMIAIANNYGVYFIARYQDINASHPDISVMKIVQKSADYLVIPVLMCGLTTIFGIMGLVAHLLIPARQMGVIAGVGITFALVSSLLFIPAVLSLLKKGRPHKDLTHHSMGFFPKLLVKTAKWLTSNPIQVIILFVLMFIVVGFGIVFMKVAPDSNKVLPDSHDFNIAVDISDRYFGGSKMIAVMFEGDVLDPAMLKGIDNLGSELKRLPGVGSVTSITDIIRKISMALNDTADVGFDKIPEAREAVAQYLELYSMSGNPEDIERFIDFNQTNTLMNVQFRADDLDDINLITSNISRLANDASLKFIIGGPALIEKELSESVKTGQYYSLLAAFAAIVLLLSLIFRSFKAGIIGSLPLVFAVFCTFGLMGWLGIELDIVTALLSSISIGLGVDFTIHIFWRIKWELARGYDYRQSIIAALRTIGRGIVINAFSVMGGFAVLFLSAFPLIKTFAFLIIVSLFLCLISALIFIPALCFVLKPSFLNSKNHSL